MAPSLQLFHPPKPLTHFNRFSSTSSRPASVRCSAAAAPPSKRSYTITLLPGDGIGPEVISVAKDVLVLAGSFEGITYEFRGMLLGGAALDATGVPLPDETLSVSKQSDAVLIGAIGGYKWDKNEKHLKPETGLLQLRSGLQVFANLRPATVFPQLVDASTLKKEVAEVIYFGKPRGFGTNENGQETGFNTEIYSAHEIDRIARLAFEIARKRRGKLCSVDKANVLEASMLWRKIVTELALEYPDVELTHMYVDNAAMQLVSLPETAFATVLDKANPFATVLSAAMLLKYGLGEERAAERIEKA
ncbi:hypothetical protein S245_002152, partial [Arachis hypogaea]